MTRRRPLLDMMTAERHRLAHASAPIRRNIADHKVTGLAAMDMLAALAAEKEAAANAAAENGWSTRAFGVYWLLKDERALSEAGIDAKDVAREVESLGSRFPNAAVNPDEQRRFRAHLYRPLLALSNDARTRLVDQVMSTLFS